MRISHFPAFLFALLVYGSSCAATTIEMQLPVFRIVGVQQQDPDANRPPVPEIAMQLPRFTIVGTFPRDTGPRELEGDGPTVSMTVTSPDALTARGNRQSLPASFSVTARSALMAVGNRQNVPDSFSVTASQALSARGNRSSLPASFSVTADESLSAIGNRDSLPAKFSVTAQMALQAKGTRQSSNHRPLTGTTNSIHFVPLVSLLQVTPLPFQGELLDPFNADTVVTAIDARIAQRRERLLGGSGSGDDSSGGGGDDGGDGDGGSFVAESLPVSGPLPISSTAGRINLDYQPNPAARGLRLFNEVSTSDVPIRRILTTDGVSAGAVQINVDNDFFSVHQRTPASDVITAPGTQILIVRDFADSSYVQIEISVGPANFFGDHEVQNVSGWYCGFDPEDCPL